MSTLSDLQGHLTAALMALTSPSLDTGTAIANLQQAEALTPANTQVMHHLDVSISALQKSPINVNKAVNHITWALNLVASAQPSGLFGSLFSGSMPLLLIGGLVLYLMRKR